MTRYLSGSPFSSRPATKEYEDGWDRIFGKKSDIRKQVEEFHRLYGQPIQASPGVPDLDRLKLRVKLIAEEFAEFLEACGVDSPVLLRVEDALCAAADSLGLEPDFVAMIDALADLDYVVEGCRLECGVNGKPIADEVHRSNLSKLGEDGKPVYNADGKVIKGPNYSPPDIEWALRNQGWGGYDE